MLELAHITKACNYKSMLFTSCHKTLKWERKVIQFIEKQKGVDL